MCVAIVPPEWVFNDDVVAIDMMSINDLGPTPDLYTDRPYISVQRGT